jgi:hypothetical protein
MEIHAARPPPPLGVAAAIKGGVVKKQQGVPVP